MILFRKLFYKNFLSTGNAGTTIFLDRSHTTLVQGASGSGKSTLIDALCFGVYGKPFRNINKPALVNSINQKNLEVHVEFSNNGFEYKVIRGIKPAKFEIYCNGNLVNQDAAVRDYQSVLEDQILGMSFKTFTQIVILGSTSYTPFMQLSPPHRREVIENILDIGIFSTMNQLLKTQAQETKDKQVEVDADIKTNKSKAETLKHLVDVLRNKQEVEVDDIKNKIDALEHSIVEQENSLVSLTERHAILSEKTSKFDTVTEAKNKIIHSIADLESKLNETIETQEFFNENDVCPVCSQSISDDHKHTMKNNLSVKSESYEERLTNLKEMKKRIDEKLDEIKSLVKLSQTVSTEKLAAEKTLDILEKQKLQLYQELETKQESSSDVKDTIENLKQVAVLLKALIEEKKQLATKREIQEAASMILRDTGVKTAIIREYLPLINKSINRYLTTMDLFIDFNLDENFNEVIRSRHRDEFTYESFSAGEALRIDLAILFTWRYITAVKNSCSTNLLILDEILTGRLDNANIDIVMDMINELSQSGTNVFAIAHGDQLNDKFRSMIRFEKKSDYSVMV